MKTVLKASDGLVSVTATEDTMLVIGLHSGKAAEVDEICQEKLKALEVDVHWGWKALGRCG